jgi:hypothetical protein
MTLAEKINENGFRRWHEYELTRSFGYLGLGVLALVAALAMLEGIFSPDAGLVRWLNLFGCFALLCATGWSWLQFITILIIAESISRQAICAQCKRYGAIRILDERSSPTLRERLLSCECKKCGYRWQASYALQWRDGRI